MSKFGEVVKTLRKADGLSLAVVAKRLGSHKGYVSGIENAKVNPPSVRILRKYHKVFEHHGIRLEDLVELAWVDKAPAIVREQLLERIKNNPLFGIRVTVPTVTVPAAGGAR